MNGGKDLSKMHTCKNIEIPSKFNDVVTSEKKITYHFSQIKSITHQPHSKQKGQNLLNFNVSKKISIISKKISMHHRQSMKKMSCRIEYFHGNTT